MKELTNHTTRALPLSDGTILAAAGTAGSVKQVDSLSDDDARRLDGHIFVRDVAPAGTVAKKEDADETAALPATSTAASKK